MTPAELNAFDEVLTMIGESLELIIIRARHIRADALDEHIYPTQLKSSCANNSKDIIEMGEIIKKRKGPFLLLIKQQKKTPFSQLDGSDIDG